jgi:hypothetical protein
VSKRKRKETKSKMYGVFQTFLKLPRSFRKPPEVSGSFLTLRNLFKLPQASLKLPGLFFRDKRAPPGARASTAAKKTSKRKVIVVAVQRKKQGLSRFGRRAGFLS